MKRKRTTVLLALMLVVALALLAVAGFWFWRIRTPDRSFHFQGEGVYYYFDKRYGTLVIYGSGEITQNDYIQYDWAGEKYASNPVPYVKNTLAWSTRKVIILEGVTSIGFSSLDFINIQEVYIPASVTSIDLFGVSSNQTVYFSGDAPEVQACTYNEDVNCSITGTQEKPDVTIVHRPGTSGWDDPIWSGMHVVEQDFVVDWSPVG